jgi:hypothetical protein
VLRGAAHVPCSLGNTSYTAIAQRLAAYGARFLSTLDQPRAAALHVVCCAVMAPAGERPCLTLTKNGTRRRRSLQLSQPILQAEASLGLACILSCRGLGLIEQFHQSHRRIVSLAEPKFQDPQVTTGPVGKTGTQFIEDFDNHIAIA